MSSSVQKKKAGAAVGRVSLRVGIARERDREIELLRIKVVAAQSIWKQAKEQAGQAKRRRKLARLLAKRAKKDAKRAKENLAEARAALVEAEAKARAEAHPAAGRKAGQAKSRPASSKKRAPSRRAARKSPRVSPTVIAPEESSSAVPSTVETMIGNTEGVSPQPAAVSGEAPAMPSTGSTDL